MFGGKREGTNEFQSTLSVRRATSGHAPTVSGVQISIHALREESDTFNVAFLHLPVSISIHALREESDYQRYCDGFIMVISIHALREESDVR